MTLRELRRELDRRRVDANTYVLDGLPGVAPVEGALYVTDSGDGWEVGVQERGRREPWQRFPDESAACAYALEALDRPGRANERPWWLRWM